MTYTGVVMAISPLVAAKLNNSEIKIIESIRNDPIPIANSLSRLFMAGFVGSSVILTMNMLNER